METLELYIQLRNTIYTLKSLPFQNFFVLSNDKVLRFIHNFLFVHQDRFI